MKFAFIKFPAAVLLAAASFAATAQTVDEFAFAVPVEVTGGDAFYRLVIPQPVYEATSFADLRDLRVFNGSGEAVPYAFRSIELRSQKPEPVALSIFPLRGPRNARAEDLDLSVGRTGDKVSVRLHTRGDAGGKKVLLGYLIDASTLKNPLSGITVQWGSEGADRLTSVKLETSGDLKNWTTLANDVPLGGVSHAGQRLERNTIEFRSRQEKYLRLTWLDADKAIELDSVRGMVAEQWEQPERMWKEVVATPDATRPGDFLFDLEGRFPIDRLEFRLPQENTVVPVQVLSRNDPKDKWKPLSATVAYRLKQEGRELTSPALPLSGHADRYWLLTVSMKGGGIGAGDLGVRAGWIPRELVFTARGNGPFRLAYGNARAEASSLYEEAMVPGLRSEHPPNISLVGTGLQQKLAGASAMDAPVNVKKWALWAALLAAVALLAWMAWRLSAQMQKPEGK
jgi:hypothetical protein